MNCISCGSCVTPVILPSSVMNSKAINVLDCDWHKVFSFGKFRVFCHCCSHQRVTKVQVCECV